MKEVTIYLNDKPVKAKEGESILEVANRNGIKIPTLCHDPRLEPYSSCFVCVVEIEGMRGHQPSCSTKVADGMKIITDNPAVHKSRKTALDLLLSNHYADCAAPCKNTCPAGVDVQGYISLIDKGMYSEAVSLIKEVNPLPAICGRVCVRPCEAACRRNLMDEENAVGIDYMKRFAADYDLAHENHYRPEVKASTGKKVAVIGAGPGGLTTAYYLQQEGHQVDIYEGKNHAGGWLRYGIPEYRLPNDLLDKEVETITELGTNIFYEKKLGENVSYKDIKAKYDATVLTIGSQKGTLLGVEGEDAEGIYPGVEFLNEMEATGKKPDFSGKTVVVVGGGNTAMDCIRTSQRLGAERTVLVYRRTEKEMPANPIEIHESKLEGVEYMILTNPTKVNKTDDGKLQSVGLIKMELGEPDNSGRRRPVPIEGSEFDLECDYILAAIGQKTDVNFIDDINKYADDGQLVVNRWGDIDADPKTLQTGIKSVFAAGDGVTGAATLIEAIAQGNVAVHSVKQFLNGEEIKPKPGEFLSKRDNFVKQESDKYIGKYAKQERQEMPVMDANTRMNFKEVELGYADEQTCKTEAQRCLECGCVEYFDCDLKAHATEYGAEQGVYEGEFKEYEVDFSHPYIEIDNNKCILCSRCIRTCDEVVGASALGLVERGFDTHVAPAMGNSLTETNCISCGMCIEVCPTGAMSENFNFKPGPLQLEKETTICNYCSTGCEIEINHRKGYTMKVTVGDGLINKDGLMCKSGKFGYAYLNNPNRILKPLHKVNGKFEQISFDEAYKIIEDKIKAVKPNENMFFAGARMSNEELYMVQKLARGGAKTNNIASLSYFGRGAGYHTNNIANAKFDELKDASRIYYIGNELNKNVPGFFINNAKKRYNVPVEMVTTSEVLKDKVNKATRVDNYYYFVKAVNHYLLTKGEQNQMFIDDRTNAFDDYKKALLAENYDELINKSGVATKDLVEKFARTYNDEMNAILVFHENEISANASIELYNLVMITGKLGKTANGIIVLKEKNNSHGIADMGVCPRHTVGMQKSDDTSIISKLEAKWGVKGLPVGVEQSPLELIENGGFKNLFVFGEDPVGLSTKKDKTDKWFDVDFLVVQDSFMTDTAEKADLILPASFTIENDGSFTNTQKIIQSFYQGMESKIEKTTLSQLIDLNAKFGMNGVSDAQDVMNEIISLLPEGEENPTYSFEHTNEDNQNKLFMAGVDSLIKMFGKEFMTSFKK